MSVYSFENKKSVPLRVLSFHFAYGKMKTAIVMATVFTPSLLTLKTTLLVKPIWLGWRGRTPDWDITWRDYIAGLYATQSLRKCCRFRFSYYFSTSSVKIKNLSPFFLDYYEYVQRPPSSMIQKQLFFTEDFAVMPLGW